MQDRNQRQTLLSGALGNINGTRLHAMLVKAGHLLDRADADIKYVLMIVFDKSGTNVVGLLKMKGPAKLLGKITFPGGRRENGEPLESACSREMLEEADLTVPVQAWKFVCRTADMAVFTAALASVQAARSVELEPVFQLDAQAHIDESLFHNGLYADDFTAILLTAKHVAGFEIDAELIHLSTAFKTQIALG